MFSTKTTDDIFLKLRKQLVISYTCFRLRKNYFNILYCNNTVQQLQYFFFSVLDIFNARKKKIGTINEIKIIYCR